MSLPLENCEPVGPVDDGLLDRLVDGELPDEERRTLLLRLEAEREGWRRCALAFLEAQSWREALSPLASTAATRLVVLPDRQVRKPRSWQPVVSLTGLAASVAAAFAVGWVLHLQLTQPTQDASIADGTKSVAVATVERREPAPADIATEMPQPRNTGATFVRVDPFVKKMEQRGFRAQTQQRLLSMQLKDGRKFDLPVQEVRLQYVRNRTY
jgi:anti-sigma factor RsiW